MNQDELKHLVGAAALEHVQPDSIIGVGTGSTVNCFIDSLINSHIRIEAAVSSSEATTKLLRAGGIQVLDLNQTGGLDVYIDGADEFDEHRRLIKGGGGALTREKIVAAASKKFVCIADQGKQVKVLGTFPLPLEVIPLARSRWHARWLPSVASPNGARVLPLTMVTGYLIFIIWTWSIRWEWKKPSIIWPVWCLVDCLPCGQQISY